MPTNDERRDVAARLRELDTSRLYDGMDEVCALEDACGCDVGQDWQDMELKDRLAELIEPEPERTTHFELIATAVDENGDALAVGVHCAICGLLDEDEIGADPDNWMLWRYCPSCGAEVVS